MADITEILGRLIDDLADAVSRITDVERRMDGMMRHGKVTDVDPKKQRARIEIGERDGQPLKSAWLPYAQIAGAYKSHRPPTVGQQMSMFAPNGEVRQGLLVPMTWSDQNPSPSDKADEHVTTFGQLKIVEKADSYVVSIGSVEIELTTSDVNITAPGFVRTIGKTALGLASKGEGTPPRVETEAGLAVQTYAKV
jgi:phage baseplate assembly protein V